MTQEELALSLIADENESLHQILLNDNADLIDSVVGRQLIEICLNSWASDPKRASAAAKALNLISKTCPQPEIIAYAEWGGGIAAMIDGELRRAVSRLDRARQRFDQIGEELPAASTQIAKLYPLAMLGRYDEAVKDGLAAREVFKKYSEISATIRVEHNLGNILQLSERYEEAEEMLRSALELLTGTDDKKTLAQVTNSLAFVLSNRYKFAEADELYERAFALADEIDLAVTKAEIESNIGYFSLFQGRYDRALDFLGRARMSYDRLGMPHQCAKAELEMADAYLEMNLNTEAASLYERTARTFAGTGMAIEHARSLANLGRIRFLEGDKHLAHELLSEARRIFVSCGSSSGEATVLITRANILVRENDHANALTVLREAEVPLAASRIKGAELNADLLRAECLRETGRPTEARTLFEEVLYEAESSSLPIISARSLTELGRTAEIVGDIEIAEAYLTKAIEDTETLRTPLPSEDFRAAFFGDKLTPYREMARLCLKNGNRVEAAFEYIEKSRSRSLVEFAARQKKEVQPVIESPSEQRMAEIRTELNWLYNQINQPAARTAESEPRDVERLHLDASQREIELAELFCRQQVERKNDGSVAGTLPVLDLAVLREKLGDRSVLLEYVELDGKISAFLIDDREIRIFSDLCTADDAAELVQKFYFQIETLKSDPTALAKYSYELTTRSRRVLGDLYDLLVLPMESSFGKRSLAIAPTGYLNYVPFQALYDGFGYLVEERDVSYTPSATFMQSALQRPARTLKSGVFAGVQDSLIPHVNQEIELIADALSGEKLLGSEVTAERLATAAKDKDVLHIACHGHFRADNPLFSSLKLAEEWLTVRDLYSMDLGVELVVLSACETGVNSIAPGDELLGLTRGFLSAGVGSLVMSLWNVHDVTTAVLMKKFYMGIANGLPTTTALCEAQRDLLRSKPHPFFWSPFVALG